MLVGQVLAALRARGQATLDASAAHAAGSSPRLPDELEEAVDPVNEGPGERPPLGPGLPPSIHASGVDCWRGLVEFWANQPMSSPSYTPAVSRSSAGRPRNHRVIQSSGATVSRLRRGQRTVGAVRVPVRRRCHLDPGEVWHIVDADDRRDAGARSDRSRSAYLHNLPVARHAHLHRRGDLPPARGAEAPPLHQDPYTARWGSMSPVGHLHHRDPTSFGRRAVVPRSRQEP